MILFTAWVNPSDDWDQYEGFSFWVNGQVVQEHPNDDEHALQNGDRHRLS